MDHNIVTVEFLETFKILLHEPFADFLLASAREINFEITLLEVVKFGGHACPP